MRLHALWSLVVLFTVSVGAAGVAVACPETSFIGPDDLKAMQEHHEDLVIIDARKREDYQPWHIPGAVNLPPNMWRTPSVKPGEGDSQYIFLNEKGEPDIARYEKMLGEAGITRETPVVVYGNHAGKGDGSIPAMILDLLGHEKVYFLDGFGATRWGDAGYELTDKDAPARKPVVYKAQPKKDAVWDLDEVVSHLGDEQVVFYDTRSPEEYEGTDDRPNARHGRIPGAVLFNYADMLNEDRTSVSIEQAKSMLEAKGITPDKTIVLYCQTATRVSLPYLKLKDLGYENIKVYDASWHEYGNRPDTPIETDEGVKTGE